MELPNWGKPRTALREKTRHAGLVRQATRGDDATLESVAQREHGRRIGFTYVKDLCCEIHFLVRDSYQETALDFQRGLVRARALHNVTESKPLQGRVRQLGPRVEKIASLGCRVEYIFVRTVQLQIPVCDGKLQPRRNPIRVSKHPADHGCGFQYNLFPSAQVVAHPQRRRPQGFVVVSCFHVQPVAVHRQRRRKIGLPLWHEVSVQAQVEFPRIRVCWGIRRCRRRLGDVRLGL